MLPVSMRLIVSPGLIAVVVCGLVVSVAGGIARAQDVPPGEASAASEEPRRPQPIPLEDVPDRAETIRAVLDALRPTEASEAALEPIEAEIEDALPDVHTRLEKTRETLAAQPTVRTLQALTEELRRDQARVSGWEEQLDEQLDSLRTGLKTIDGIAADWEETHKVGREQGAAETTLSRIAAVRREIARTRSVFVAHRNRVLAVRDRLVDPDGALSAALEQVQLAAGERLQGVLQADRSLLWSGEVRESAVEEWKRHWPQHFVDRLQARASPARLLRIVGFQFAMFVALYFALRALREHARARAEEDYGLRDAEAVFERPAAMALLIVAIVAAPLHALGSGGLGLLFGAIVGVATVQIGRLFLSPAMAPLAWGFVVLFLVDQTRDLLDTAPTLDRMVFLAEMLGALGLLVWLLRPKRLAESPEQLQPTPFLRLLGILMRAASGALAFAIAADAAGWGELASLIGSAALQGGYTGFFVFVSLMVVRGLATFALVLWPLRLLHSISMHRILARTRLERILNVLAGGFWAGLMLQYLGILGPVADGVARALGASASLGALSISAGDVLAFVFIFWLSFWLARLVNFILQEDVFTRVHTGRGVPYAIAGLVRYTLIFVGFFVGLSAAGVEFSKLTVIVGGLGVGIGFGLQNVVNNFVSGLILLFERPIQVGDAVQLPDVWGSVKRIGIRASVIRTFDGAEVIVPNGMLISERVTNWTLSDKHRRIELNVGVTYGTPAQTVIDLLVGVAKANPRVVSDPEPCAFFLNFGDSALEFKLRSWIANFDDGYQVHSEIAVAVQQALKDAGIGVPFPQRDLHLVSVSPDALSAGGPAPGLSPPSEPMPDPGNES